MKIKQLLSLPVAACLIMSTAAASSSIGAEEVLALKNLKEGLALSNTLVDEVTNPFLVKWMGTCDRLRDCMVESIALLKGSKHNYSGHSIGELTNQDQSNIAAVEGMLEELALLKKNSVIDVFSNPIYQTGLEQDLGRKITELFSIEIHEPFFRDTKTYPLFIALEFPFKFSFGRQHLKYVSFGDLCNYEVPLYPKREYYRLLIPVNPSISVDSIASHLDYVSIHMSSISRTLKFEEYSHSHFLPQSYLERLKLLSKKIIQHYAGPYWHGTDEITSESARHLMLKLNDRCNDLVLEPDSELKRSLMAKTKQVICTLEGALIMPELFEKTFINTQDLRYSRIHELKAK